MKVWVYVEGRSDKVALSALWRGWKQDLGRKGWGIEVVPLENKSKYFKKIGPRSTEKLMNDRHDLVVGLPDLYPNRHFEKTDYRHDNLKELVELQKRLVRQGVQKREPAGIDQYMNRFYASALKHDLEMLLLAAPDHLRPLLKMKNRPHGWRLPPEDQNQERPPKKIIEELFRVNLKRSYLETKDSHAILRNVDLSEILFDKNGQHEQCPTFRAMLDWVGKKTGVRAYNAVSAG